MGGGGGGNPLAGLMGGGLMGGGLMQGLMGGPPPAAVAGHAVRGPPPTAGFKTVVFDTKRTRRGATREPPHLVRETQPDFMRPAPEYDDLERGVANPDDPDEIVPCLLAAGECVA